MLNELGPSFRQQLLDKIASFSPDIAKLARRYELMYMDVLRVTPSSLPQLIAKIPESTLLLAWRLSRSDLRAKWLSAMSQRRQEGFLAQVEASKPAPKSQIFRAQDHIVSILKTEVESGRVKLESRGLQRRKSSRRRSKGG